MSTALTHEVLVKCGDRFCVFLKLTSAQRETVDTLRASLFAMIERRIRSPLNKSAEDMKVFKYLVYCLIKSIKN